jgi:hypothetical protein
MFNRPNKEYLDSLKVGDEITYLIREKWESFATPTTIKVVRRTPKQIVFSDGRGFETKYRAEDGKKIGGGDYYSFLPKQATEFEITEENAARKRVVLARRLTEFKYSKLPLEALEQIKKIIDQNNGE